MSSSSASLRDTITFATQKVFSISVAILGANRITRGAPSETSLAVAQVLVGGALLAVAAIVEVMMWRSRTGASNGHGGGEDGGEQLSQRLRLLEEALIERLPPTVD